MEFRSALESSGRRMLVMKLVFHASYPGNPDVSL